MKTKRRLFQTEIWTRTETKKWYSTGHFSGMASGSSLTTETRHDPALLVQMNHSRCKRYQNAYHMELQRGWFEGPKLQNEDPEVRVLKQIIWECIAYVFLLIHSTLQVASNIISLHFAKSLPFQGSPCTYSFSHLLLGTSYLPDTVLGAEDALMN